jgi:putative addiction module component (TIGR02574 family)
MSIEQLTAEAMALPFPERIRLAQALWQSIDGDLLETDEREAVRTAIQRDAELSAGTVEELSHDEVMRSARRALGCE